jgi:hypothetical protein
MDKYGIYIMLYFILILMVELIVLSSLSCVAVKFRKNPWLAIALTGVLVLNMINYDIMRNHRQHLRPGLVGTSLLNTNWILPSN